KNNDEKNNDEKNSYEKNNDDINPDNSKTTEDSDNDNSNFKDAVESPESSKEPVISRSKPIEKLKKITNEDIVGFINSKDDRSMQQRKADNMLKRKSTATVKNYFDNTVFEKEKEANESESDKEDDDNENDDKEGNEDDDDEDDDDDDDEDDEPIKSIKVASPVKKAITPAKTP
ncbi:hypothetical protein C6P40_005519, partial [Pichia californica]